MVGLSASSWCRLQRLQARDDWLDKAYAHLDSGLFDEADIAEVEELAAAYYDGPDVRERVGTGSALEGAPDVGDGSESA